MTREELHIHRVGTTTTLALNDQSGTLTPGAADNCDLLLDHVRVTTAAFSNTAPVAIAQLVPVDQDGTVNITLTGTDIDEDILAYTVATPPLHGSVNLAGNIATYTPSLHYIGPDSFTFIVNDGSENSAAAQISIMVNDSGESLLINGSFESGYTAWSHSGNQTVEPAGFYTATDGIRMVAFNAEQKTPDGCFRKFPTAPGSTYQLDLDCALSPTSAHHRSCGFRWMANQVC